MRNSPLPHPVFQAWETKCRLLAISLILWSVCASCSALKDSPEGVKAHPAGWLSSHAETALTSFRDGQQSFCQSCHGANYTGGKSGISCVGCHQSRGDGQCVACHGGADNFTGAPPVNLRGVDSIQARGVGAHTTMVEGFAYTDGFDCSECHVKPEFVFSPGHFSADELSDTSARAEVNFSIFANPDSAVFDSTVGACRNTYCHGNFTGGNDALVVFSARVAALGDTATYMRFSQAACGSCHNIAGDSAAWDASHAEHVEDQNFDCVKCHNGIASVDPDTVIFDRAMHVNGIRDVAFDTAAGPSPLWNPVAQTCANVACHGDTTKIWVR